MKFKKIMIFYNSLSMEIFWIIIEELNNLFNFYLPFNK